METTVRAEPNVTPMIDVMLVLLIVFMLAAPILMSGVAVEPPRGVNLTAHPDDPSDRTLAIDAAGRLYLDKQPIALVALAPRLRTVFAARPDDRVLYLRADARVDYALVTTALDSAREGGARVVGMIAEAAAGNCRTVDAAGPAGGLVRDANGRKDIRGVCPYVP